MSGVVLVLWGGRARVRFLSVSESRALFWSNHKISDFCAREDPEHARIGKGKGGGREENAEKKLVACWRKRSWSLFAACSRSFMVLLARCGAGSSRSPRLGQQGGGLLPHADCRSCPQRWVLVAWNDFSAASTHTMWLPAPGASLDRFASSHRSSADISTRLRGGGAGGAAGGEAGGEAGGGGGGEERVLVLDVDNCLYNEATAGIEGQIVEGIHRFCAG